MVNRPGADKVVSKFGQPTKKSSQVRWTQFASDTYFSFILVVLVYLSFINVAFIRKVRLHTSRSIASAQVFSPFALGCL